MHGYLEAPIDDKNVLSGSIIENLFDDGNYVWERNEAVGFISGYPCLATYSGNRLSVGTCLRFPGTPEAFDSWCRTIIERITGSEYTGKVFISHNKAKGYQFLSLLDDETNADCEDNQLISSFWMYTNSVDVYFHWNKK